MLTPRKIEIFKAIVLEFINTAEPIGSKTLIDKYKLPYSSATIRNEMADLEKLGLLEKTHTSSGRVPSTKGYQFYVEYLMDDLQSHDITVALSQIFSDRQIGIEEAIRQSSEILSQMTRMTSVVLGPGSQNEILAQIRVIPLSENSAMALFSTESGHVEQRIFNFQGEVEAQDIEACTQIFNERLVGTRLYEIVAKLESLKPILERQIKQYELLFEAFVNAFVRFAQDEVYFSGEKYLLYQPEFSSVDKLRQLMSMLEDSSLWHEIARSHEHIKLKKSEHSELVWLDDMAVISGSITDADDEMHRLMVVGPSRMEYNRIVSLVEYVAQMIETVYGKGGKDEQEQETSRET